MEGAIILIIPFAFFMFLGIVVFSILIQMIILGPYYSLIKRWRLYRRLKEKRRRIKQRPQRFFCPESTQKESEYQKLVSDTLRSQTFTTHRGEEPFSCKKLLAFSRKDYIIIAVISLSIMAFKAYVYIAFFLQPTRTVDLDQVRFGVLTILILLLTFISACALITVPIVMLLHETLTIILKKKLQRLKEIMLQQDKSIE